MRSQPLAKTKVGGLVVAALITAFAVFVAVQARPAPGLPLIHAVLAGVSGVALWRDAVAVAVACALLLLIVSLLTFFSFGLLVILPAAGLVALIAAYSQTMAATRSDQVSG